MQELKTSEDTLEASKSAKILVEEGCLCLYLVVMGEERAIDVLHGLVDVPVSAKKNPLGKQDNAMK